KVGQFYWPKVGQNKWPLTATFVVDMDTFLSADVIDSFRLDFPLSTPEVSMLLSFTCLPGANYRR
ncbi:hypothetical protein, partial [Marinobacter sp. OP 3.4]|uniref:hypothetical protein n=1 Tax=Marinobacter sp. OP 3.4 TaxID=3076501 RepID=UPI002E21B0FC